MRSVLEEQIESTREAMVYIALKEGFNSPKTLALSSKLDELMNQYAKNKLTIS